MTRLIAALAFLFAITLTGCATTTPTVKIVTMEVFQLVEPDPIYLNDCKKAPGIPPAEYKLMGVDERENALVNILISQYGLVDLCTGDKKHLRALIEKQRAAVDAHNAAEQTRAADAKLALEKGN